jgi:hypothetical protein
MISENEQLAPWFFKVIFDKNVVAPNEQPQQASRFER